MFEFALFVQISRFFADQNGRHENGFWLFSRTKKGYHKYLKFKKNVKKEFAQIPCSMLFLKLLSTFSELALFSRSKNDIAYYDLTWKWRNLLNIYWVGISWYFNLKYLVKDNTDRYKLSHSMRKRNENLKMHICNEKHRFFNKVSTELRIITVSSTLRNISQDEIMKTIQ